MELLSTTMNTLDLMNKLERVLMILDLKDYIQTYAIGIPGAILSEVCLELMRNEDEFSAINQFQLELDDKICKDWLENTVNNVPVSNVVLDDGSKVHLITDKSDFECLIGMNYQDESVEEDGLLFIRSAD